MRPQIDANKAGTGTKPKMRMAGKMKTSGRIDNTARARSMSSAPHMDSRACGFTMGSSGRYH